MKYITLFVRTFTIVWFLLWSSLMLYNNNNISKEKIKLLERRQETSIEVIEYLETELYSCQENSINDLTATVYNAEPNQCNDDYLHTASMFKLDSTNQYKHRIIAISRDLKERLNFGDKVEVIGTDYDGIWYVQDVMNKRYTNRIDLLINKNMKIGKWNNVKIIKL